MVIFYRQIAMIEHGFRLLPPVSWMSQIALQPYDKVQSIDTQLWQCYQHHTMLHALHNGKKEGQVSDQTSCNSRCALFRINPNWPLVHTRTRAWHYEQVIGVCPNGAHQHLSINKGLHPRAKKTCGVQAAVHVSFSENVKLVLNFWGRYINSTCWSNYSV